MYSQVQDLLFTKLKLSPVLKSLFSKLFHVYTSFNFGSNTKSLDNSEINKLLYFASLLSKSTDANQKIISEEIIALLDKLYPNEENIKKAKLDVLSSCTNYIGLSLEKTDLNNDDLMQDLSYNIQKASLKIPYSNDYFLEDQKEIFDSFDNYQFVSYSAPTSLGKSFVMRAFLKFKVAGDYKSNFAVVVPTKALINEMKNNIVEKDLKELLELKHYRVVSSINEEFVSKDKVSNFIFVVTPERLHYLLNDSNISVDYCFIDESYKISEPDSRSLYYYQTISQLLKRNSKVKIFFSSPNIPNPEIYLNTIRQNGTKFKKASTYSPVSQIKYLLSLKEADQPVKIFNDLTQELEDSGVKNSSTNINDIISTLKTTGGNIVYCSGKDKTIELAIQYANFLPTQKPITDKEKEEQKIRDEITEEIRKEIHEEYYLAELIKKGVAYHVGYLPNSLRDTIEKAFKNGIIKTIFCTSTLMEGINLPADNLFVTSTRNGTEQLTPTAFKNLLGRIGRINFSLYGNVYLLIIPNYANADTYKELLTSKVEPQSLSLDKIIKNGDIIDKINTNSYDFGKKEDSQTLRIATNIYINDIKHDNPSLLKDRINDKSNKQSIDAALASINNLEVSDSIDISPDQHVNLKNYIAHGGHYPNKRNGRFEHDDVKKFLDTLSDIYKWDKYEFEILKNGNSNSYYATVLSQWMSGLKVKEIVDRSIDDKKKNPYDAMYDRKLRMRVDYIGSKEQNNEIINNTLKTIEQTILFTIANYFREFSKEYKKLHNLEFFENDWYEFVEFGTDNQITIALQRNGYVRENAKWINEHSAKLNLIDKAQKCKFAPFLLNYDALINCGEKKVEEETKIIKLNVPELFK